MRAKNHLRKQIEEACAGLLYPSETDAEILPFFGPRVGSGVREMLINTVSLKDGEVVEERSFEEVFERLTTIHDWFGEREKARAERFTKLRDLLNENLDDLKVVRIGRIQIDIYIVGIDAVGNLAGVKTKSVET